MYDFRTLSPLDFEELVRDLLQAEFGFLCESFGSGPDLGIDFRFASARGKGAGIIQAKHYADSGAAALVRAAERENAKIGKLRPQRYLLATSVSLTPQLKSKLLKALPSAPLDVQDVLGRQDLNNLIGRHPEIERKHFKLWLASTSVLERILHSGVYNRTATEMSIITGMVPKFVQNKSVPEAEAVLAKHGALIISGEPGVGKSTLARMLVWLHAAQGWKICVIDDIKEAFEIASEGEKRLIFFDDFLGQVRLSSDLIRSVDQRFPPFFRRVRGSKDLRFILTTRDYILRQAQAQSGRLSSSEVDAAEFILNVGFYTRACKARMLYNHLYFSQLSRPEIEALLADDFFLKIIDHRNFNPRLIELLTSADYASMSALPIRTAVQNVLDHPEELWAIPYRSHISDEGRTLMLAVFFNAARPSLLSLERSFSRMASATGIDRVPADLPKKFRAALRELEGSVLAIHDRHVNFSNPGIRDFLRKAIAEDGFLPAAVKVVTDFAEVSQAWRFDGTEQSKTNVGEAIWFATAKRMLELEGSSLRVFDLTLDIYHSFRTERMLALVDSVIEGLRDSELDYDEADDCINAIELTVTCLLPMDTQDRAKEVITALGAKLIADRGSELNFDEVKRLASRLSEFGSDPGAVRDAVQAGLEGYVSERLSEELDEIGTVDELTEFENELTSFFSSQGVSTSKARSTLSGRKEALQDRENEDDDDRAYRRSRAAWNAEVDDNHIRSIFRNLRSD